MTDDAEALPPKTDRAPRRRRRWLRRVVYVLIGLPLLAWLTRAWWLFPLALDQARTIAADELGLELQLADLSGSLLTGFELSGIETLTHGDKTPLRAIDVERLRVEYSLFGLLTGSEDWLERIELHGLELELNLDQGEPTPDEPESDGAYPELPAYLPRLDLTQLELAVHGEDFDVELTELELRSSPDTARAGDAASTMSEQAPASRLVLQAGPSRFRFREIDERPGSLQLALSYRAGDIVLESLRLDQEEHVRKGRIDLQSLSEGRAQAELELALFGGRLTVDGELDDDRVAAELRIEDLNPAWPVKAFAGRELDGRFGARAELQLALDDPTGGNYSIELALLDGHWQGAPIEALRAQLQWDRGQLTAPELRLRTPETELTLTELALAVDTEAEEPIDLQNTRGRFALSSRDLSSTLQSLGVQAEESWPPAPWIVDLAGRLDGQRLELTRSEVDLEAAALTLNNGRFEAESWLELPHGLKGALSAEMAVKDPAALDHLAPLPALDSSLELDFALEARGADEALAGRLQLKRSEWRLDGARMDLGGELHFSQSESQGFGLQDALNLTGKLMIEDLARARVALLPVTTLPEITGQGQMDLLVQGSFAAPVASLELNASDLRYAEVEADTATPARIELRLAYADQQARLESIRCDLPGVAMNGEAVLALPWDGAALLAGETPDLNGALSGELQLRLDDLAQLQSIAPVREALASSVQDLAGQGTVRLQVTGQLEDPQLTGQLDLAACRATLVDPAAETQQVLRLDRLLAQLQGAPQNPSGAFQVQLQQLEASGFEQDLKLLAPVDLSWIDGDRIEVSELHAAALGGEVRLTASAEGLSAGAPSNGRVQLELAAVQPPELAESLDLKLDLALAGQRLELQSLQAHGAGVELDGALTLPFDAARAGEFVEGPIEGNLQWTVRDLGMLSDALKDLAAIPTLSGSSSGELVLAGSSRQPDLRLHQTWQEIQVYEGDEQRLPDPVSGECSIRTADTGIVLETLQATSELFQLNGSGSWPIPVDIADWMQGGAPDLTTPYSAELKLVASDLAPFAEYADGIRRLAGKLDVDLRLEGGQGIPNIQGEFHLTQGELRLEQAAVSSLGRLEAHGRFEGQRLNLTELSGDFGGSPFEAEGFFDAGHEGQASQVELELHGDDLLLFRQHGVKVRADTGIRIAGPLEELVVSGRVDLTDARMVKNFDLFALAESRPAGPSGPGGIQLFSFPDPPLSKLRFDLEIGSVNGFRLKNNIIDGMVRPDLKLTGTGEVPELEGNLYVDPTYVSLPATRVRVSNGVVRFLEDDPFVPRLEVTAETRYLGYDVNIGITGRYDEPIVTLSSVPPLPADHLLLMITTGQPPDDPTSGSSTRRALGNVAVYLGRSVLADLLGDESTESTESFLERFSVETGRDVTRQGAETIEGRFRLTQDVLTEGDALFIVGEKDAYDDFNMGIRIQFQFR